MIRVGDLARRAGLTAKAVRHYDRIGLLRPDVVDDAGCRWYLPARVDDARHIAVLRSVDIPLEDIGVCVADPTALAGILAKQRRRLDARIERVRGQRHILDHLHTDGLEHPMPNTDPKIDAQDEKRIAAALFNGTWTLIVKEERTLADDDDMLHMAHASRYHWARVPDHTPAHLGRGEWQCSRVYAVLGRSEPALHHAQRYLDICTDNAIGDWDLAFAYEALARGHAVAGDIEKARAYTEQALAAAEDIADDEDRELLLTDLESIPGLARFW